MNNTDSKTYNQVGFNAYQLGLLFKRGLIRCLSQYKLTPEQYHVIEALENLKKPISQSELARYTMKDRHSISRILGRMEKSGWVTRYPHSENARITLVTTTDLAKEMYPKMIEALSTGFSSVFENGDQEKHCIFLEYSEQMISKMLKVFPD